MTEDNLSPNENEDNLSPNEGDPSLLENDPINNDLNQDPNEGDPNEGDPNEGEHWYDQLESEDLRNHPKVKQFKTADDAVKSYLELQNLLGHEKMPIPKDENDTQAIDMVNKILGVPEEPKGYNLEQPEVPEGLDGVMFGMEDFQALAHKHNLTPKQAEGIMGDYVALLNNVQKQSKENFIAGLDATKNELKQEWGLAFEPKVKLAQSVMNKFTESKEEFDVLNARLGTDPASLKFLAKIGENFAEGSLGDVGDGGSRFTKTPVEAKKEYDAIMNDPNDIYWSGVRNQNPVSESVRKERVSYVESLLRMSQPA